eukprot:NODE_1358_length_1768_cov_108.875988_g1289_i0.p1 GENE.NODE_1358_length_1768_cov_108.875988_g1289_i0~~NODE_1358_length_1768_cov_108.875988_g1289_i0.p1  ORF type:complete len:521 (+),score=55.46 NODE_1358_length_1768_cov_108.875988_g1289_i0:69-1565(+)
MGSSDRPCGEDTGLLSSHHTLPIDSPPRDCTEALDRIGLGPWHFLFIVLFGFSNVADAVELSTIGYILDIYRGADDQPLTKLQKSFLTSAAFGGMIVGGFIGGILSDLIGHKRTLCYALILNSLSGLACAASPNAIALIFFRVLAGLGCGGIVPALFTWASEMLPESRRGFGMNAVAFFWCIGTLMCGGMAYYILDGKRIADPEMQWRVFLALCSSPALLVTLFLIAGVPESPHWLIAKKRHAEARTTLLFLARANGFPGHPFSILPNEEPRDATTAVPIPKPRKTQLQMSMMLFGPKLLRITIALLVVWFMLSFASYGLSTWIVVLFKDIGIDDVYLSALIFNAGQIPGSIFAMLILDSVGRRLMLELGLFSSAILALLFAFGKQQGQGFLVGVSCAFSSASVICWQVLNCLSTECFPTSIRSTAMGFLAVGGRVGVIVAQFVNAQLMGPPPHVAILLVVTGATMFVGLGATIMLPRDAGEHLVQDEDVAEPSIQLG